MSIECVYFIYFVINGCFPIYRAGRCDNIRCLRFQTNNVGLVAAGNMHSEHLVAIEQWVTLPTFSLVAYLIPFSHFRCFVEPLKVFLSRKNQPCQTLDLGAIEALTYYGQDFLKAIYKPQEMLELTLCSIKYDPSHYPILELDTTLLQKCAALQVLSLDYDTLSDELLHTIQVLPLRKFLIVVHGLDREEQHVGVSDAAWANFAMHFTEIDLVLTLLYAYEAVELLDRRVVGDHMPVTHIRILFCELMNHVALDWMSVTNSTTLRSIYYIDSGFNRHHRYMSGSRGQDPFVMLAWRCKKLEEIVVHGHPMDPHNLLGIARLRSRQLRRVEVSQIDWCPNREMQYAFNEVSARNSCCCCIYLSQYCLPRKCTSCWAHSGHCSMAISYRLHCATVPSITMCAISMCTN